MLTPERIFIAHAQATPSIHLTTFSTPINDMLGSADRDMHSQSCSLGGYADLLSTTYWAGLTETRSRNYACWAEVLTWKTMSPPSSMTAGRMRVSSSSLIMATTSLSSSEMAVFEVCAAGSVNRGSPACSKLPHYLHMCWHTMSLA